MYYIFCFIYYLFLLLFFYFFFFRIAVLFFIFFFFFSSRRRHTRCLSDWSSDVCSSDLDAQPGGLDAEDPVHRELPHQGLQAVRHRIDRADERIAFGDGLIGRWCRSEERRVGKEGGSGWGECV